LASAGKPRRSSHDRTWLDAVAATPARARAADVRVAAVLHPAPPAPARAAGSLAAGRARAVRPGARVRLVGDLQRWLIDRLTWLRPRTIPILVACAALPAMLALFDIMKFPEGRDREDARVLRPEPPVHRSRHLAVTAPTAEHRAPLHDRLTLAQPIPAPTGTVDYIDVTLVDPDPR